MPRLDKYHKTVKNALIKDGWEITHDPFVIKYKGLHLYIDLAAKRVVNEKEIAIEIKVFGGLSFVNDFEKAVGQYNLYKDMLERVDFKNELYLAISEEGFDEIISRPAIMEFIEDSEIYLLIFDAENEELLRWIK